MNSHDIEERGKKSGATGKKTQPDAGLHTPDANVGMDGQCIVPQHPESARQDTGEPCDDDRAGVRE